MYLAEDLGIFIYYQDTDSMHILDSDIKMLTENSKNNKIVNLLGNTCVNLFQTLAWFRFCVMLNP